MTGGNPKATTEPKWKTFEEQVRGVASLIFGVSCLPQRIVGVDFDGVVKINDLETAVIEITRQFDLDKVRQGVARLTIARNHFSSEGIVLRGYIVLPKPPTPAMIEAANSAKMYVMSIGQFTALFFQFATYKTARLNSAFGSSIDPVTGDIDNTEYVPVKYILANGGVEVSIDEIGSNLEKGKNIILLGEYGSGKSRCVRETFMHLSNRWSETFQFPFAVNLRECWGLERGEEVVRRGVYSLGHDGLAASAVRALNRNSLILLLDGFDELGSQSWSSDENRLRQLRARALSGVRDLVRNTKSGCLIAGREHYFSSNEEMMSAIGVDTSNTIIIKAKDEFSDEELETYFDAAGISVDLPTWLPRKPLICQTIALLSDEELESMFRVESEGVDFWNHFIKVVCRRDARINSFFDEETIYRVFVALSRITRNRPSNVGPVSQRDLQDAFEAVVGQLPVEEASAMLQRLPSLGRIGAESQDRQFVDMFILDGLRAKDVAGLPDGDDARRQQALNENWLNPLQALGQSILSADMKGRFEGFKQLVIRASNAKNPTLAADIISAFARLNGVSIDLSKVTIEGGNFGEFDLRNHRAISNFNIVTSIFEKIILPSSPPSEVAISNSMAGQVSGAASYSGLPAWLHLDSVDKFDSVQTVSQIRRAGLSQSQEILVAILKKTFKQKGSGRKEEALLRGFGTNASKKIASNIISILMREDLLSRHKGDEGWIYSPVRGKIGRVNEILEQLRSSTDSVWAEVTDLSD